MSVLSLIPEEKRRNLQGSEQSSRLKWLKRKESLASVYSSNSRLSLLQKRKRLSPLEDMTSVSRDRAAARVLSANARRVKQLQNQLADAHFHLQELSNENKVLRVIQKKHEIALQRFESSNVELPQVLNSHNEELRIQQAKYKQLKSQHKEVMAKLKDREFQLQQLRDEHGHLLELAKDKNLQEREKLQAQVGDLTAKVQQQGETISNLQRRLVLEAKNFKHQLHNEMNKHKDTRHDLDLAISNADKLSTIIEIKEKMLSTVASRSVRSPTKTTSAPSTQYLRPASKTTKESRSQEEKEPDHTAISRICQNSRSLASVLSHDEETSSSAEPRSKYIRSRSNSTTTTSRSTPNQTRKNSKGSDDMIELAKTVQDGMAELSIFDEDVNLTDGSPDEIQKKIDSMKLDLLNKIKNNEEPLPKKNLRRMSTEESIEESIVEEIERPKSRGRRSTVSFYEDVGVEETITTTTVATYKSGDDLERSQRDANVERKLSGKPIEKYCKDIMQDIEKSNRAIDRHMKDFNNSKFDNDKIIQQLEAVDKISEFVNGNGVIPTETLSELNNNFKMLTDQVLTEAPVARKRSLSGRKSESSNLFGDASMSNQDLLNDLLGKK